MAVNDFTGQNIQDTYQKVVQTDGTNLADGTGSLLPISFDGNNVIISGSLTATEYSVSSSVTNIVIATLSGSTKFGDSTDDTHTFTGDITASGNISSSDSIYAHSRFYLRNREALDASPTLLGINEQSDFTDGVIINRTNSPKPILLNGHITASGNISASGTIDVSNSIRTGNSFIISSETGTDLEVASFNELYTPPTLLLANIASPIEIGRSPLSPTTFIGNITASGAISASGIISAEQYRLLDGTVLAQLETAAGLKTTAIGIETNDTLIEGTNIILNASVTASDNISSSRTIISNQLQSFGSSTNTLAGPTAIGGFVPVHPSNVLHVEGSSKFISHITASGNISASGTIIATGGFGTINGGTF